VPPVARYWAVLNSHQTDIGAILREALETEGQVLALYKQLLARGEGGGR
jgi:bacterioferritin